jgi:hypothetical protein
MLKLTVQNLGRIRHAAMDLRPLTVFIGPNNTNKSWAAYAAWKCFQLESLTDIRQGASRASFRDRGSLTPIVQQFESLPDDGVLGFSVKSPPIADRHSVVSFVTRCCHFESCWDTAFASREPQWSHPALRLPASSV